VNQVEIGGRRHSVRLAPALRSEALPAAAHAETVRYFDGQAPGWVAHYTRSPYFRTRLRTVLSWIAGQPSGLTILDYGCGSGVFLKHLIDAGHRVTGVDVSLEMLASARRALESAGVTPERFVLERVGESCKGGYLDSAYDGVMSLGVLEYLDDPVALLEELVQHLRPGGFLILSLPNRRSLVRRLERIVKPAALRTVERVAAFRRVLPRLAGPEICFRYQKYQFDLANLERFLASRGLRRRKVFYHGAPSLLRVVEEHPAIGDTVIVEFVKT
jgi:2-polyprenyl-3-methyl-5-hydroxy-6-metoxy-1,4-benzoquinol methylase